MGVRGTGIKFLLITDPQFGGAELAFKRLYEIYSEYVMRDPFYAVDMPIRSSLFDGTLSNNVQAINAAGASGW